MYETTDYAAQYRSFDHDELLALWRERNRLADTARRALRDEINLRGLSKEAESPPIQESAKPLAPPVETYLNASVLFWWLREIWLRLRTRRGFSVRATVESTSRTRPGYKSAARAELSYSFAFQGRQYSGRVVRDFLFDNAAGDSLAFGHKQGQSISVRLKSEYPECSYYPSGFGWIEPLLVGLFAVMIWVALVAMVVGLIFESVRGH